MWKSLPGSALAHRDTWKYPWFLLWIYFTLWSLLDKSWRPMMPSFIPGTPGSLAEEAESWQRNMSFNELQHLNTRSLSIHRVDTRQATIIQTKFADKSTEAMGFLRTKLLSIGLYRWEMHLNRYPLCSEKLQLQIHLLGYSLTFHSEDCHGRGASISCVLLFAPHSESAFAIGT